MSRAGRRLLSAATLTLLAGLMWLAYEHWVLESSTARFRWGRADAFYQLVEPRMLGVLLVAPLIVWGLGISLADLPWPQRVLSGLLRLAFLASLAIGLSHPTRIEESQKVCAVALVDVSDSVSDEALVEARHTLGALAQARRPDDTLKIVTFAARPRLVAVVDPGHPWQSLALAHLRHTKDALDPDPGAGSDLQAALQLLRLQLVRLQ